MKNKVSRACLIFDFVIYKESSIMYAFLSSIVLKLGYIVKVKMIGVFLFATSLIHLNSSDGG